MANRLPALDGMVERHARLVDEFDGGTLEALLTELAEHIRSGSGISPLASYMRAR